jgi:hypothetical protein
MSFVHRARRTAALLAVVAVGACSESTGPNINIDAQAASAKIEPVLAVMEQPAFASFGSLAAASGLPASASSAAALSAVAHLTKTSARGRLDASAPLLARAAARSAEVIPIEARGLLFTYNETSGQYEGAQHADAPDAGIRIMLYGVDPLTWQILTPATPIGYVDLIDESGPGDNRLRVIVVRSQGSVELMNYAITHSSTASSESFSIVGTATNGTTAVNFNLSGTASETSATATFTLTAPSVGFGVAQSVTANLATEQATVDVELEYDNHTLAFSVTISGNTMNGELRYDDRDYATFSMTYDEQTGAGSSSFTKANGRPMTIEEIEAIGNIFERALDFDDFWASLLWPVGALAPTV